MQPATAGTVLGDFRDATFSQHGVASRFFSRDVEIDLSDELPLELRLFVFWVVVQCWRRNAGGVAAAVAAACS